MRRRNWNWTASMRKLLLAAIALTAITPATAQDMQKPQLNPSYDFKCVLTDINGHKLFYEFGPNTGDTTVVENMFARDDHPIAQPPGVRPVWDVIPNNDGTITLLPENDRGWLMRWSNESQNNGILAQVVTLYHGKTATAQGICTTTLFPNEVHHHLKPLSCKYPSRTDAAATM
jgi:hypothetical protein